MLKNTLLLTAISITIGIVIWSVIDNAGLNRLVSGMVNIMFVSRGWFIMLTASMMLIFLLILAFSSYGNLKLGSDYDVPEFSTTSWLAMMFAAGMGVGLLYYGAAEPLTHYVIAKQYYDEPRAAEEARFLTNFHWGLHAWAIYGMTALVIAYFSFRKGCLNLISEPLKYVFGTNSITASVGWLANLVTIIAVAIGVAGSVAMGVFQITGGVLHLMDMDEAPQWIIYGIFSLMCLSFIFPLMVNLSKGMALLSNIALGLAIILVVYILLMGPTSYMLGGILGGVGEYLDRVIFQGFQTYTFFDGHVADHFNQWTLNYMAWWLAWGPFVGIFVARISKGRTIREFILGVLVVPTLFSIFWFGTFGSIGFYGELRQGIPVVEYVEQHFNETIFFLLSFLPFYKVTSLIVVVSAFLFIVTSVVSAAFVLGMFSTNGSENPPIRIRVIWGGILAALSLMMIISDSIDSVRSMISLGAMPFVFLVHLLMVSLYRALKKEKI